MAWIIFDTKQQNISIYDIVVGLFGNLWIYYIWYLSCDIYYYYYSDNVLVWISFGHQQQNCPEAAEKARIKPWIDCTKTHHCHVSWVYKSHIKYYGLSEFCEVLIYKKLYT